MPPNAQERVDNETPYAIVKLRESARIIRQSINELPILRRRLEKSKENKIKAREVYGDLQNQHLRLLNGLETAALSLLECEQDEQAIHSAKLVQSIKAFNLMTPDYTKLCTVLNDYLSKLPLLDMLSCDNDIDSGATSLKLSAEYLVDVTSRNLQYNSREHFDFAILFFLYMGFCYFITNF